MEIICQPGETRPTIITLCGSTKFKREFMIAYRQLTIQGYIVLSVGVFEHADHIHLTFKQKDALDALHRRKIDLSDGILVIDHQGYIGESTRAEIRYALSHGKSVSYWSDTKGVL